MPEIICVQANAPTALGGCEPKRNRVAVNACHIDNSAVREGKFSLRLCVGQKRTRLQNCVFYDAVRRVYEGTPYLFNITPFPGTRVNVI
jgi:hypothetical protein